VDKEQPGGKKTGKSTEKKRRKVGMEMGIHCRPKTLNLSLPHTTGGDSPWGLSLWVKGERGKVMARENAKRCGRAQRGTKPRRFFSKNSGDIGMEGVGVVPENQPPTPGKTNPDPLSLATRPWQKKGNPQAPYIAA